MIRREHYGPDDILQALKRRRWVVIIPFWLTLVVTVLYTSALPNRYESEVRLQLVPAGVTERYVPTTVRSSLDERLPTITGSVLNGRRLEQVVTDLNLYQKGTIADPLARFRADFRVRVVSADAFVITYVASDPRTAQAVAERLGGAFIDENRRRSEGVAAAATDFLDAQLEDARARLEVTEQQLGAFNREHAGELPSQLASTLQMLQNAQSQRQAVREAITRDRDDALALDRLIEASRVDVPVEIRGASAQERTELTPAQQLQLAQQDLRAMQTRLRPEHPDIVRAKRHVAQLEAQVRAASGDPARATAGSPAASPRDTRTEQLVASREKLERQLSARALEEARLTRDIEDYTRRIDATPGREVQLTSLTRDYETLKKLYDSLLAKKEDAKISAKLQENEIGERFALVMPASLPARPASPNRLQLNIVGIILGLLLGLACGVVVEFRDDSLRMPQDVPVTLGLPLLATIPVMMSRTDEMRAQSRHRLKWLVFAGAAAATVIILWQASS